MDPDRQDDRPDGPTALQLASYRRLRNVIFGVGATIYLVLVALSTRSGELQAIASRSFADSTARASALTLVTVGGLIFIWFAAKSLAKRATGIIQD